MSVLLKRLVNVRRGMSGKDDILSPRVLKRKRVDLRPKGVGKAFHTSVRCYATTIRSRDGGKKESPPKESSQSFNQKNRTGLTEYPGLIGRSSSLIVLRSKQRKLLLLFPATASSVLVG